MKTNQKHNNAQQKVKEVYEKPQIEIIEMEVEGNYLLSASKKGNGGDYTSGGGKGW